MRVWNPRLSSSLSIASLAAHSFGINCVAFTACSRHLVSVGSQHDQSVHVWDWRAGRKIASNKVSFDVRSISCLQDGTGFVTAGDRHVRFWYTDIPGEDSDVRTTVPLQGRSAILGEHKDNQFVAVCCGRGEAASAVFAVTRAGLLLQLGEGRLPARWVELRLKVALCLAVGAELLLAGGGEGLVRCLSPQSLLHLVTLPLPTHTKTSAEVVALAFDERNNRASVFYGDHSLVVWGLGDIQHPCQLYVDQYHGSSVWGLDTLPGLLSSFVTCGEETVRLWNIDPALFGGAGGPRVRPAHTITVDTRASASKRGLRCLRVSPGGDHLATGDWAGIIRVFDTATHRELHKIDAHDAEVAGLEYSSCGGAGLLASCSRDRLVHLFDVERGYVFLSTQDDHSGAVTGVRFRSDGEDGLQLISCGSDRSIIVRGVRREGCRLALPRQQHIIARAVPLDLELHPVNGSLALACQDRKVRVYPLAATGSTKPRLMQASTSKSTTASLYRLALDRSGNYVATSSTDKTIAVYNFRTGELVASLSGHSELVTGITFSADNQFLISTSADSCIFIWKLPSRIVAAITDVKQVAEDVEGTPAPIEIDEEEEATAINERFGSPPTDMMTEMPLKIEDRYRFSIGKLPFWAREGLENNGRSNGGMVSVRNNGTPRNLDNCFSDIDISNEPPEADVVSLKLTEAPDSPNIVPSPIGFFSSSKIPNLLKEDILVKSSSISKAWRDGNTPVQLGKMGKKKEIENDRSSSLDSPLSPKNKLFTDESSETANIFEKGGEEDGQRNHSIAHKTEGKSQKTEESVLASREPSLYVDLVDDCLGKVQEATENLLSIQQQVKADRGMDIITRDGLLSKISNAAVSIETLTLTVSREVNQSLSVQESADSISL